jgi:hypothetical protein
VAPTPAPSVPSPTDPGTDTMGSPESNCSLKCRDAPRTLDSVPRRSFGMTVIRNHRLSMKSSRKYWKHYTALGVRRSATPDLIQQTYDRKVEDLRFSQEDPDERRRALGRIRSALRFIKDAPLRDALEAPPLPTNLWFSLERGHLSAQRPSGLYAALTSKGLGWLYASAAFLIRLAHVCRRALRSVEGAVVS